MFLRIPAISALLWIAGAVLANAQDVISVYTNLDLDNDCEWVSSEYDGASAACTGYADYPVHMIEGDLRMAVVFGPFDQPDMWIDGFLGFNYVNDVLEWRIEDDKAYATILRWFVSTVDADGEMFEKDILVVSSVANPDLPIADRTSCHIAYVDPSVNTNANQLARQAAHLAARTFRCGVDIPIYIGAISEQTLSTNHWHPINFED